MERRRNFLWLLGFFMTVMVWCAGSSCAYAAETASPVYTFDKEYVQPGDSLGILQDGQAYEGTVKWTVKKVAGGGSDNAVKYTVSSAGESSKLAVTADHVESFLTAEVNGVTLQMYCSRLPVIYIDSETAYYSVEKDNYTKSKTTNIRLVGNEKYSDSTYWYDGAGQVKLRGNSTAKRPKRPFKMKLDSKADLLGLGQETEDGKSVSYPSKHWVLLANDIDHSLLRNKLLYDFSGEIGTEFYFHSTNTVLIYNGEYEGVYQLCEHRRVDPGRIDITDWTAVAEDAADTIATAVAEEMGWDKTQRKALTSELEEKMLSDFSWMDTGMVTYTGTLMETRTFSFADFDIELPEANGGFLAEMDFYSIGDRTLASIATNYEQPLYFSAPEPGEDEETDAAKTAVVDNFKKTGLYQYANAYTQTFEYALHSDDFVFRGADTKYKVSQARYDRRTGKWSASYVKTTYTDDENEGKHYSELFDMDSLVTNFLFCEYAMNWDSMKNSFFYYKDVNELAKIGPQWDFDWCWGNTNMYNIFTNYPTKWHTTIDEFTVEQYYQNVQWNRMLIRDPYFLTLAYEKYQTIRPVIAKMVDEGGLLDEYEAYLKEAGEVNDLRWSYTYSREYSGATSQNFSDSVQTIRTFLQKRVEWLDEQFASVDSLVESLGYYKTSDDIAVSVGISGEKVEIAASTSNEKAKKVVFQINGTTMKTAEVSDKVAKIQLDKSIFKNSGLNVVVANEADENGDYLYLSSASDTGNYNVVKSDYEAFNLDKLDSLVVREPESETKPTLTLNVKKLKMQKGTTCTGIIAKSMLKDDYIVKWKSSNKKVVKVNANGKLTAKKTGKAVITATTFFGAKAKVTITVVKGKVAIKKITLTKTKLVLKKGKTYKLKPELTPISASEPLSYKSKNVKIASVTKKGVIKAKKKGTVVICVSGGKKTVKVRVQVK